VVEQHLFGAGPACFHAQKIILVLPVVKMITARVILNAWVKYAMSWLRLKTRPEANPTSSVDLN
jgi:hypothetical protein